MILLPFSGGIFQALATANRVPLNPSHFDTLDEYSFLGILERVDSFGDLATIASLSPRARQLILHYNLIPEHVMKNATLYLHILGANRVGSLLYRAAGAASLERFCSERVQIFATLKAFCPLFRQLDIELNYVDPHGDVSGKLLDYVSRYCSTVPQTFKITEIRNAVQEFTAPNAFSVSIQAPECIANVSIATHFPRVQELYIRVNDYFTSTECLPHLRHLEVDANRCGRFNFRAFAAKNPQITSAKLVLCEGLHILQEVNELLPNLVSLYYKPRKYDEVPSVDDVVQSVRFRNVKEYTIDLEEYAYSHRWRNNDTCCAKFSPIHFDQLETLKYVSGFSSYRYRQLDLVGQYKGVKSLDYSSYHLCYDEVRYLIDSLPNMSEITFLLNASITENGNFLRLLAETNVNTVHVTIDNELADEFRASTLSERWTLQRPKVVYLSKLMTFSRQKTIP